jgi:glycosyltransferase involved in cell wall biosynthesis
MRAAREADRRDQASDPRHAARAHLPLVVFSHLRWDFVYQRPQHVMSRLARRHPILFVEEPVPGPGAASLECATPLPNLEVIRPRTPLDAAGFDTAQLDLIVSPLQALLQARGISRHVAWLYTPMALPLASRLAPDRIVYDCMDDLSSFLGAPQALRQHEGALLRAADVVFTGGPSLYRARRDRHHAVYCFPSSVDRAHFARARVLPSHPAQDAIARPRLGYFGVIDERMDLPLLAALADARKDWQLVMVGPAVKVDVERLPKRANIHWLGQRAYEELPRFLAGWDVCLLPFALNHATRYISPTKTPEYLAAGRPVVSTALTDVADVYHDTVRIARDADAFIAHCEAALTESESTRQRREARADQLLSSMSWDRTVEAMRSIVFPALPTAALDERPVRVAEHVQPAGFVAGPASPA